MSHKAVTLSLGFPKVIWVEMLESGSFQVPLQCLLTSLPASGSPRFPPGFVGWRWQP